VPATVVVGAQWGDEGKGKIVDLLAQSSDLVCRYQGGPNAGHTIKIGEETFKIRQIPTGIISGKISVIGNGCVVDPEVLIGEIDEIESRGYSTEPLCLSGNAHLIMPWHVAIDQASERRLGKLQIGTTKRGIGPAYADKALRIGIRVQDVLDAKILRQKIEVALAEKNHWLERVYDAPTFDLEDVAERYEEYAKRLRPFIKDTSLIVDQALRDGKRVLFEGAQGTLLDLDHGTYPFVTSSSCVAANAAIGSGVGPQKLGTVVGIAKAYVTRVGSGPFPTELHGAEGDRLRELGSEFGATTGRPRRCGWPDGVVLRYATRVNGLQCLALTKMDILSAFDRLKIAVAYQIGGERTTELPADAELLAQAVPIYEEVTGWSRPLQGTRKLSDLPREARHFIDRIQELAGVPVSAISVGAEREETIAVGAPFRG
jgi:adenylosuccinate synthase